MSYLKVRVGLETVVLSIFPLRGSSGRSGSELSADSKCQAGVGHAGYFLSGKENSA